MRNLKTQRLLLRPFKKSDALELFEYAKDPEVGPNAGWKPHDSVAESMDIINTVFAFPAVVWAIILKEEKKLIGSIGLDNDIRRTGIKSRELGYSLSKNYWNKGIMTEAACAVIEYGFTRMDLELIAICTNPSNIRSQRVIEKCGFAYEGTLREAAKGYDGKKRDSMIFSLLREEWENNTL